MLKRLHFALLLGAVFALSPLANGQMVTISGTVSGNDATNIEVEGTTATGQPFSQIVALLSANNSYSVSVPSGGTYTVRPENNEPTGVGVLNGVTTYDKVLIVKHINGENLFVSPFQRIAADVNDDQQITLDDTLGLTQLILGITPVFPDNSSWRFVRTSYVFPNPEEPWNFQEEETFTNLTTSVLNVNFIGVKIGDVNGTAVGVSGLNNLGAALSGNIIMDANNNCLADSAEIGLQNWFLKATVGNNVFTTLSKADGSYFLPILPLAGSLEITPPNELWGLCGPSTIAINPSIGMVENHDLVAVAGVDCPRLTVDMATTFIRRCFEGRYYVQYCNTGTTDAEDAYLTVHLDPFLHYVGASLPHTIQTDLNGDTILIFPIGDMPFNFCGNFTIDFQVSCETELGQTHCSEALFFPDTVCAATPFSNLIVEAKCLNNDVQFTITNKGADMTDAAEYVVLEDIIVQMVGNLPPLESNESQIVTLPANGSTYRVEVAQATGHPFSIQASAAIEGCGTNTSGGMSQGFVTLFSPDDASPNVDIDCQVNVGSFDPNDKQGFPLGIGAEHAIRPGQDLDYLIRFQNTGTDTAFTVRILDTLPSNLEPSSIRFLGSSHACEMSLSGGGILQFLFKNILLPDSFVNEAASHGFVKFHVAPKSNMPIGATIQNRAGIYFDFNAPVITNTTLHTVKELVLSVNGIVAEAGIDLEVFPNPAVQEANFLLKTAEIQQSGVLLVFDAQGRAVVRQSFSGNQFSLATEMLQTGLYFFKVENSQGRVLASGKLAVDFK